ncbi:MAG TPA: cardiolipin synthase [Bacilli bacterium]|nr:cardiolipin synthase [Bacilli bacterium]
MHILHKSTGKVVAPIVWLLTVFLPALAVVLVGLVIFLENRNPEKTVAWLVVLAALPIVGFLIYLLLGRNARKRKLFHRKHAYSDRLLRIVAKQQRKLTEDEVLHRYGVDQKKRLVRLLLNNAAAPLRSNNRAKVLTNGEQKFASFFEAVEQAKHHIHLEYYIFKDDEIGGDTKRLLIRKVQEGVQVRLILDGLGSRAVPEAFWQELRDSGVEVVMFFPVRFPWISSRLNFRNHRKIVIVDGRVGFLGGMNIGDEYLSRNQKMGFWRDTHLRIEGESVHFLQATFLSDWMYLTNQMIDGVPYYPKFRELERHMTQIAASGPDSDWESIRQVFFTALATAERKIYIETPYFVPGEDLIMALKTAALSGVDVRLIVQGIPEYKLTYWASRSYYESLLKAGVKIYEYQKGILHAKVLMVDDVVGSVGSANMDIRSFELNFETSALLYDPEVVARLEQDFWQDVEDSRLVQEEAFAKRPLSERLKESGARLLSPLL